MQEWSITRPAPTPSETSSARPDRATDFIYHAFPLPSSTALDQFQSHVIELLFRLGFAPRRMLVRDLVTRAHLAPIAKLVGSRLQRVRSLPAVEEASADFKRFTT